MEWGTAISGVNVSALSGRRDVDVRGVQYDSRRVSAGDVFVAMRGGTSDGNQFVDAAIRKGAVAIVTDSEETFDWLKRKQPELAVALVTHGRRALAEVSSAVFGAPEKVLKLCAVTGTNGKTTVAYLLEQLLRAAVLKCVLLGTIETHVGDEVRESEHTTPESRDVLRVFADGVAAGCTEAVMEMSSHALEQERVWGMPVDVAVFTNLTQDHLDYHGTMERYARAKARLFEGVGAPAPRVAVINADDAYAKQMMAASCGCQAVMTYGINAGDWRAKEIKLEAGRSAFLWSTPYGALPMETSLTGTVNVYNLMAACCAAIARGISTTQIVEEVHHLDHVPGRFEIVNGSYGAGFAVVVDYAHTDDALENLIALARDLAERTGGRVITMFGCGGDRDRTKRSKMGRVAASGSDFIVVTSDNPRTESPKNIIDQVMIGVREVLVASEKKVFVEEDRRAAIRAAIRLAKENDIVLLAGKGHEKVQVFADGAVPFDDVEEAARALRELKDEVVA